MSDAIIDELRIILAEDYSLLSSEDICESPLGNFQTVAVVEGRRGRWTQDMSAITKTPDGRFFRWTWSQGLTEYNDDEAPNEYGEISLTEVKPREVVVTTTVWDAV